MDVRVAVCSTAASYSVVLHKRYKSHTATAVISQLQIQRVTSCTAAAVRVIFALAIVLGEGIRSKQSEGLNVQQSGGVATLVSCKMFRGSR